MGLTVNPSSSVNIYGSGTPSDPFWFVFNNLDATIAGSVEAIFDFSGTIQGPININLDYLPQDIPNGTPCLQVITNNSYAGVWTNQSPTYPPSSFNDNVIIDSASLNQPSSSQLRIFFQFNPFVIQEDYSYVYAYISFDEGSQPPPSNPISLYVQTEPALVASGQLLNPQPIIGIKDQYGNVVTNYQTDVQVSLVVLSGSATLTGTTTVSTTSGVATFTDLVITGNGLFYLQFDSTILALNSVNSNQLFFPPDPGNPNPPIPVKPKRSYIAGSVPAYTDLEVNEFAINVADRKGYMRDSNDIVHLLFDGYASGGGGSGGTVYSVGVSSTDLDVSNSPITTSGFIGLDLKTQSLTAATYGDASNVAEVTVNQKGIVTDIKNVPISYPVTSVIASTGINISGVGTDFYISNTEPDQIVGLSAGSGIFITGSYPNFQIDCTITQYSDNDARMAISAGSGISYNSGTGVITNSYPDQIVVLTAGTGISVTGTYPNFTIDSTITQYTDADARLALSAGTGISYDNSTGIITNSEPDQVVSLTGGTDIGVTGTYPNFTIDYTGTAGTGTVTSVGITSTAAALTITNSPITTSGDIGVNFSGLGTEYVAGDGSLKTFPTTIDQALNLVTEVYNETGSTLTKGTVVYINGGHGNLPTVTKAQANNDANSAQTYGVVQSDISDQDNGYVVVAGRLLDLDTFAYPEGTQLYLSPTTAGAWTSTKPSAPNHLVYVGIVVRSHNTQGVVEIKIQNGYELHELHDVSITSVSPSDILRYNSSTKLWENVAGTTSSISEGSNLYYTDARARLSLSAGTGISYDNSTGVITNSSPDQTVVLTAGTGISTSGTYPNFTITNSDPDQTVVLTAGTGMSITGTYPSFTITNDDPDQTVSLTAGTGISVSGTYPSFTVTNSSPDQTVKITAGTGISVSGTYPNFTVTNSSPSSGGTVTSIATTSPITGGTITGSGTIGINASSTNTASYVVQRDASGNFSAGTITASLTGTASTATNIAGGGAGQIPYNTGSGSTSFLAAGTSGQVLRSNGTAAPSWEVQGLFSGGRLTLTSGTPVTTSDVTSASNVYYTPYNGDKISLYNTSSSSWVNCSFTEKTLALSGLSSGTLYDVFGYLSSGTLALDPPVAWSTTTSRSSAISFQNGIYVKTTDLSRRYLGTFRATAATTTEDSATKRLVWNFNNRVSKNVYVADATGAWTYGTAAWRYANNNSNNKIEFVAGLAEDTISAMVTVSTYATTAIANYMPNAALNSTSGVGTYTSSGQAYTSGSLTWYAQRHSNLNAMPQLGYNYVAWLEYSGGATGTINVVGANDNSKMLGVWRC